MKTIKISFAFFTFISVNEKKNTHDHPYFPFSLLVVLDDAQNTSISDYQNNLTSIKFKSLNSVIS